MNGQTSNLIVGTFVLAGIVATIAVILWLAGDGGREASDRYVAVFERDISGLTLGAPVRYLGVDVGEVVDIGLSTRTSSAVRIDIEVRASTPVSAATYASLAFQGVTGVAFISLGYDPAIAETPIRADVYEFPLVPVRDTGLAALLASGGEITDKVSLLLDRSNELLATENVDRLSETLDNLAALTRTLAARQDELAQLPGDLRSTLADMRGTLTLLQGTLDSAAPDMVATMAQLREASGRLAATSSRLDSLLADNGDAVDRFLGAGLGQAPALITETRDVVRELEKLVDELRADPSRLIYKPQRDAVEVPP